MIIKRRSNLSEQIKGANISPDDIQSFKKATLTQSQAILSCNKFRQFVLTILFDLCQGMVWMHRVVHVLHPLPNTGKMAPFCVLIAPRRIALPTKKKLWLIILVITLGQKKFY